MDAVELRIFVVTRTWKDLIYRAIAKIQERSGPVCLTVAIEWICAHYLNVCDCLPALRTDLRAAEGDRCKQIRLGLHPDQEETINLALEAAKERIGLDDDGAALADICATFLETYEATWGDAPWPA